MTNKIIEKIMNNKEARDEEEIKKIISQDGYEIYQEWA